MQKRAQEAEDEQGLKAAQAVEARVKDVSMDGDTWDWRSAGLLAGAACLPQCEVACPPVALPGPPASLLPCALSQLVTFGVPPCCPPSLLPPPPQVGYNYFRLHPKGVGLVCQRPGGLPPLTFVEEYFGEIHTPWRWFEIQVGVGVGGWVCGWVCKADPGIRAWLPIMTPKLRPVPSGQAPTATPNLPFCRRTR